IDADDLEEMDLKWQMAMLTMREKRFLQRTGRNLGANGTTSIGFDMSKMECYNCHKRWHFARECRSPKDTRSNIPGETQRRNVPVETSMSNALVSQCDGMGSYDWRFQAEKEPTNYALMAFTPSSSSRSNNEVASCSKACIKAYATLLKSVEARLLVYQQNETIFEEDIKLLKLDVELRDNALVALRKKFKKVKQERDELKLKLEKFQTSSKNLSQLLASQTNDKTRLGYDNQVFTSSMFDCDKMFSESDVSIHASKLYDRPSAPLIEDWVSDSEDKFEGEPKHTQNEPSFVEPTKHVKTPKPSVKIGEHPILVDHLRKDIPKSRGNENSRNRKACFVCKSLTHLIKDCDYYEKKMVQKPVRNHAMRGNSQHYARMTTPNPQRHVVPIEVLTISRLVPLSAARLVNTAVPQTKITRRRPAKAVVTKPYSPPRRNISRRPSHTPSNFPQKVIIVKAPNVNAIKGFQENWVWKPKCLVLDHVSRHTSNPQHALKDKGIIDSGCSRHMTGNMSYLFDFEAINGGYVTFGENSKGGKITRKGKIKTGKLGFDDVYFVKELKFNIFSVSQMCDKKNNVLFTDTECIVLSSYFKLPDDNHVLLRVPSEDNMHNVELKNIVSFWRFNLSFCKGNIR
nr:ribonuclease H-like domain-containing protein [Tanacetum cinerariifolium]